MCFWARKSNAVGKGGRAGGGWGAYHVGMDYQYGEFDGQGFLSPDKLFPEPKVMRFILQYGEQALEAMQGMEGEEAQAYIQQLIDAGLLEPYQDEKGKTRLRITARMLKGFQHKALEEMFENLRRGSKDGHQVQEHGRTTERADGSRAYEFGDALSEIDLGATMRNAVARQTAAAKDARAIARPRLPIHINSSDFELHETEGSADCATVMLIDLSGSMMRYGRFLQAKRVAMGMQALISGRFPQDTIDFVTFYTLAERIQPRDVPVVMPKPVTIHDYEVRVRVPLAQAEANPERIPLHFTNLQLGLRTARQVLSRSGAANKQIFVITDGQPTAHIEKNPDTDTDMLYLVYPPSERTAEVTLKEAIRCRQQGIRIASFALIEDYWGMDWVGFIERLTRLTRGVAYYCTSDDLSSTVIESYLTGRKKKSFIH